MTRPHHPYDLVREPAARRELADRFAASGDEGGLRDRGDAEGGRAVSRAVTLWYTPFEAVAESGLIDRYRGLLDPGERAREGRFHRQCDRERHVIAHVLQRTVLTREAGGAVAPEDWRFATGRFGKPSLRGPSAPALSFNLTHADGFAAVAVTRGAAVGIDAERIGGNAAAGGAAAGLFAGHEAAAVDASPPGERAARFLEYWTLKEAWVKAVGGGISFPMDRPAFRFPTEGAIALCAGAEPLAQPSRWKFWQMRIDGDVVVAVCAGRTGGEPLRLKLRKLIPLAAESEVACVPQRESE